MAEKLDIVLIQIRERSDVAEQERDCFLERCGVGADEIRCHNVVKHPKLPVDDFLQADAFIVGGSGLFSATNDDPFTDELAELIRQLCLQGRPLFGACWGHQFMARALGGVVSTDESRAEVGTHEVQLTPNGQNDPVFSALPERFLSHMGHNDHVIALPEGAVELATTPVSANQAFRLRDLPIYGTQFHAELGRERLIERLWIYREIYASGEGEFEAMKRNAKETPDVEPILRRWIDLCVRPRAAAGSKPAL